LSRWIVIAGLASLCAPFLVGCGGSGGGGGAGDLWVRRFSVPNFTGILLDEDLTVLFSEEVLESSLNHDSIRIRTGTTGGEAPRGVFVKGVFMVDPATGTRVVIDPDQVSPLQVNQAELQGLVSLIPVTARYDYDPEMKSPYNGNRQVLFDKSKSRGDIVTFVPEIPTEASMLDTGLKSASTYSIVVPTFPSLNTVQNLDGDPCLPRNGQVFVSTFTTIPINSAQPFLAGESEVRPRIVNSSPPNGAVDQPFDTRISLRFSQPLDPRSISTANFFLTIASVPGRPQIPVSLFLRQTRLGTVEVILTPLQDLPVAGPPPADPYVFEVTVNSGVLDLLGQTLVPVTISFSTGGAIGTVQDIVESFDSNAKEDVTQTTANWNARLDYVGAEPGALVASFAPFAGSGGDGPFVPNIGETTVLNTGTASPRVYNYNAIDIGIGATVTASGNFGLVMRCQGTATIRGTLDVRGGAGGTGGVGATSGDPPNGGAGGTAGVGGWGGGDGAMHIHDASNFDGLTGDGAGGGIGGHSGDQERDDGVAANRTREAVQREGGGGGAYATGGEASDASWSKKKFTLVPNVGGTGGTPYSLINPPIVGTLTSGFGGSGGGGGGGEDDAGTAGAYGNGAADGWDEGGGGGGGGGGGVQIIAYDDIEIEGMILADGGAGGSTVNPSTGISQGAPGGGGSGGAIFVQTYGEITIAAGSSVFARGGAGGQGDGNGNDNPRIGGVGGDGFIRLQDSDGSITISPGTVDPEEASTVSTFVAPVTLSSAAYSGWYNQYIVTPNYGEPIIDYSMGWAGLVNSIIIEVQGSRENVATPGPDPVDPDNDPLFLTTSWRRIFDSGTFYPGVIDGLDNYQYLRFRVMFSVDPAQEFVNPLPKVTRLVIPVSSTPD
jgi:hypothetical protein